MAECQYIGPEQDPRKGPVHYCGKATVEGKSYCHEHYWIVYQKGSAIAGRRKERELERQIEMIKHAEEIENV